ncbi:MAG: MotA/TolQ/ExbB proton channel family protein [Puniceicoccales bacterium]|jgi:biopolymer transport protein ExbB|nr:MotA/TolQ/ExbB proton channel family protein [Puniceicoccales bacterium]
MVSQILRKIAIAAAIVGVAVFAALPLTVSAQTAPAGAASGAPAAPEAPKVVEERLIEKIKHVHPVVLFCLIAGSVLMVWFGVDGVLKTTRSRALPQAHIAQLRDLFKQGDYVAAYTFGKANPSPLCDVVRAGVTFLPDGKGMTEEAMFNEITRINGTFMGRVSYLSVIGVCAPMVGLCGTVFGMMSAFATLGSSGVGDPSKLSAAIGEVLVATAMGLLLAIPAFVLYYVLRNRITVILHDIQSTAAGLFRKMPYESFDGVQLGEEEVYASQPNWVAPDANGQGTLSTEATA